MEEGIRIKPITIGTPSLLQLFFFFFFFFSLFTCFLFTDLEEDGVRIALTIVDTPGFGDNINNEFAYVFFLLHSNHN